MCMELNKPGYFLESDPKWNQILDPISKKMNINTRLCICSVFDTQCSKYCLHSAGELFELTHQNQTVLLFFARYVFL